MKYSIIGSGDVGFQIAGKLLELGHEVMVSSRTNDNPKIVEWSSKHGERAHHGTFEEAAQYGERVFICVRGIYSPTVVKSLSQYLEGKIIIDLSNPYIYKDGNISLEPSLSGNTSVGEENQKALPNSKVVKTLNYLHNHLMTNPQELNSPITGFYCGNDAEAKKAVDQLLRDFGWQDTLDLGDISRSRYTEMLGAFWPAALGATGTMHWGFKLVRDE